MREEDAVSEVMQTPGVLILDRASVAFTLHHARTEFFSDGLYLLDYGAGNVRSLYNAMRQIGYTPRVVRTPADIARAKKLVFPGVGSFGSAMAFLKEKGFFEPLRKYVTSGKPYLGICIGLQVLFKSSEESPGASGLGVIPDDIRRFDAKAPSVPHIGWNGIRLLKQSEVFPPELTTQRQYFVHSYRGQFGEKTKEWALALTDYGGAFIAAVQRGAVVATQFHPEKSGIAGLQLLKAFLAPSFTGATALLPKDMAAKPATVLAKRLVVALDVRPNDQGVLVVTKGNGYDVREAKESSGGARRVRNLGDPVDLAERYYEDGTDELVFLNIKAGAVDTLGDTPMMRVLERASERIFVPLTVGGGIRDYTDKNGGHHPALEVAARYFRAGADKVSIGSDAVKAAEAYLAAGERATGKTSLETIAAVYGRQAVVVSIDPRRVYLADDSACASARAAGHTIVTCAPIRVGPKGETRCWYQCTIKGGRETRPLDTTRFARACEALGAGELLVNCIDQDGRKGGFDTELLRSICEAVSIPVVASSGAGCAGHFEQVFRETRSEAALGAGMFHRGEATIADVKRFLREKGIASR